MILKNSTRWLKFFLALILGLGTISQIHASSLVRSDILLHIVTQCVDPAKENYCVNCAFPRADKSCNGVTECKKTNEVWALTDKYVAIRDIKMCGCPASFVHGLSMPRKVVTGVEDANKEEDIWRFAWTAGLERIEPASLALVVNPKSERTQNQLHVHMLRLNSNSREMFASYSHAYVRSLDRVWVVAQQIAVANGLVDYGVLVANDGSSQYIVVVTKHSPEATFTIWNCHN